MENSGIFWAVILWMVVWGVIGSVLIRRRYLARDLDTTNTVLVGALSGAALGPVGLVPLWLTTPRISNYLIVGAGLLTVIVAMVGFALGYPDNICVTSGSFVASQATNGLVIGIIYGFMALGLTLIFSILGIVSFAHGEFYMIGGMLVYYITTVWFPGINPLVGLLGACVVTFLIGAAFERLMLTPMYHGKVDRPVEYGILVTFGLAFTLQYFVQALTGANPVKVQRFIDFPRIRWPHGADPLWIRSSSGGVELFGTVTISNPRLVAAVSLYPGAAGADVFPAPDLDRQGVARRQPGPRGRSGRGDQPRPDEHAGLRDGRHDRRAGGRASGAGVLVAAAGRQHSCYALLRHHRARRARLAAGRLRGRHPRRPGRGRGHGLHSRRTEGGLLHPRLRHDPADADVAPASHRTVRAPLRQRRTRGLTVMRRQVPNIAAALFAIFLLVFPLVYTGRNYPYVMHILITAFFYAILAASWSMLAGYAGQFSFGHMGFMGIGAYTTALICHYFYLSPQPTGICAETNIFSEWLVVVNPIGVTSSTLAQDCLHQAMEKWGDTVHVTPMPVLLGVVLGTLFGGLAGFLVGMLVLQTPRRLSGAVHAGLFRDRQGHRLRRDRGHPRSGRAGTSAALSRTG